MIQIKEKLNNTWNWIKEKAKKIAIALGIIGIAMAAGPIIQPEPIPLEYQLKVPKEKVLLSKEVDWIVKQLDGTIINKGKIVSYDYISNQEVGQATFKGLSEDVSKRTGNVQFFKKGIVKGKEQWVGNFYPGTPFFYIPHEQKWYQTETATTTIDAFNKQMKPSVFEKMFEVYALSFTNYSGAGDGASGYTVAGSWDSAHNPASGSSGWTNHTRAVISEGNWGAGVGVQEISGISGYTVIRGFVPIDISGLADNAVVSAAILKLYKNTCKIEGDDAQAYITVVGATSQASITTLAEADFDTCSSTHSPTKWSDDISLSSINSGSGYIDFTLNAAGIAELDTKKGGTSGNVNGTWMGGFREGHDIEDVAPASDSDDTFGVRASEWSGTGSDPYLEITYTVPLVPEPDNYPIIRFE